MNAFAVLLASALVLMAAPAAAQSGPAPSDSAATLPSEQPTAEPGPDAATIAAHKRVLEKTIADMKASKIDYASMSTDLAAKVRASEAAITPALQTMGRLQAVEYVGEQQGALKFKVAFEQATTTWFIGLGPDGKIAFLVLRTG